MRNAVRKHVYLLCVAFGSLFLLTSCEDQTLPKPTAFLRLEHPEPLFEIKNTPNYSFETPQNTKIFVNKESWMKIKYPNLKATINITYRPIKNNLKELLRDAKELTTKHAKKADLIYFDYFENSDENVYGSLGNATGNVASPLQFHVTDSSRHFITGSVYFNSTPNYDSIYPSIKRIEKDLINLISTTKWHKNEFKNL